MSSVAEIALAIDTEHDSELESFEAFIMRRFGREQVSLVHAAMALALARSEFMEFLSGLIDGSPAPQHAQNTWTIGDSIKARRARGYDSEFETYIARRWQCPSCKHVTTAIGLLIPMGSVLHYPACPRCLCEEIAPLEPQADLKAIDGGKAST